MANSSQRAFLAQDEAFQQRLLVLMAKKCHEIMNTVSESHGDEANVIGMRLRTKATEFINNPTSFDEKLAISVVALLDDVDIDECHGLQHYISDLPLEEAIDDVFDGMAGVYTGDGESTDSTARGSSYAK